MRLKPVRFVGHKLGPFDHIELDWEKNSRYTLIVAENGLGKTTLVAAIAACLAVGYEQLFPKRFFQRLAHDETAYAYLELDIEGKRAAVLRWAADAPIAEPNFQPYALSKEPTDSPLMQETIVDPTKIVTPNFEDLVLTWLTAKETRSLAAAYGVHRDLNIINPTSTGSWIFPPSITSSIHI